MKRESWIGPYFRLYSGRFALYLLLGVLTLLSAGMLMFTSGFLISKSALQPYNILLVYVPIVGVRTFGIGRAVIHYVERLVGHDTVLRILARMRVRLYRILEPQALFIRSRYRTGDILGALADDIEQLQNVYIRTVFPGLVALILYAAAVIAMGFFDVTFALLLAGYIFVLVAVLPYVTLRLTRRTNEEVKRERGGLYRTLTDAVMGIGDWVISGRADEFLASYERDEAAVARKDRKLRAWARWRSLIGQMVVGLAVVSMVYWAGGQAAAGQIDATLIAAFVLIVFPLADAFLPVSDAVERIPQYGVSLARLERIEHSGGEQRQAAGGAGVAGGSGGFRGMAPEAAQAVHIRLQGVRFAYAAGGAISVDGVSLDIPQGKRVAVIGRSGAGKSTLLKLIQGALAPSDGTVTFNGVPAAALGERMPEYVSVLNQSPHLFDTTVANNIRLARPEAADEEIRRAAQAAQLGPLISALPEGLNTPMRETGQRFSGGERQRVALARILLQDTPVLILDEPTVGLDPRTERELLATIFRTTQGKTLIWVTHHLVGAEKMDEIIFMEHGRILMRGTHAELMKSEPRYRNLYRLDRPD
ncbi:MAG: thiol reductant ABC exporter subunit CydC [Paenibacillus macerans]|uniref:Thiol reductant ABC exporter subunit CydC n=3 Tax=Paenibacillus macerans TaxID=44252 RepID=A0A090YA54_PAEMA|nr:thiol reductant ABC exporter subunit CydC [Paenibacillus macerans]KFM94707.1 thiol reductant ABC exporter, CydC subunit [Paenibacillus macerans]MCY7558624.1 thiol reductant ABC exporter subunit CydC [Paenibacillus macerans]MDU7473151.1 thiol reductant ABC exporter subunit CydC [Paenibacillus macerans]MEC0334147.1 thiol reductant ABC exporter subunit CydC [Paenibacillus macerans]MUG21349.1 thiol reductant ABC exporter subunit CydC [Paenibacillus macerans]